MRRGGFTLVELMITIAIVGVMSSLGMTTFQRFVKEAKSGEAYQNVGLMSRGAAAYYYREIGDQGVGASAASHCTIFEATGINPFGMLPDFPITSEKKTANFAAIPTFAAMGFAPADPLQFHYAIDNATNNGGADFTVDGYCNKTDEELYAFYALGDLDDDGVVGVISIGAFARNGQYQRAMGYGGYRLTGSSPEGAGCPFCVDYID